MMIRVLLLVALTMVACETDEAEFPELITSGAQQIGVSSVVLEADFKEIGALRPVRYGFLWGEDEGLNLFNAPNKVDLGMTDGKIKFSIKVETLTPGTTYSVRSFAALPDYSRVFYGNEISFSTLN